MTKPIGSTSIPTVLLAAAVSVGCAVAACAVWSMLATPEVPGAVTVTRADPSDDDDEIAALRAELSELRSEIDAARRQGGGSARSDATSTSREARLLELEQRVARLLADGGQMARDDAGANRQVGESAGLTDDELDARVAAALQRVMDARAEGERAEYVEDFTDDFDRFIDQLEGFNVDSYALSELRQLFDEVAQRYIDGDVDDLESAMYEEMDDALSTLVEGIGDGDVELTWNSGPRLSIRSAGATLRSSQTAEAQLNRSHRVGHSILIDSAGIHTIWLEFDDELGDIDVMLRGTQGEELGSSSGTSNRELITRWLTPGDYILDVYFYDDSGERSDYVIGVDQRSTPYIASGQSVSVDLAALTDVVYELTLSSAEGLQFVIAGFEAVSLFVFNANGDMMIEYGTEDGGTLHTQAAMMAGRWFVRVVNYDDVQATGTLSISPASGE